jgi:hypothetical protein
MIRQLSPRRRPGDRRSQMGNGKFARLPRTPSERRVVEDCHAARPGVASRDSLSKPSYIVRLSSRVVVLAATPSSPVDATSSAPVRFKTSFARVISAAVSQ